jgi:hypothetical protein
MQALTSEYSGRTDRNAGALARKLQMNPTLRALPIINRPTRRNILLLWKSVRPKPPEADNDNSEGNAKPRGQRRQKSTSLNQDDTMDQASQSSSHDEEERDAFERDSPENYTGAGSNLNVPEDPVRLAYAKYLAHTWLPSDQNDVCPVFKDENNVVFCIPSMSKSSTKPSDHHA